MADLPNNFTKLLTAALGPAQDLENAMAELDTERSLDSAVGAQLDVIGRIVGQPRDGLSDDDYRRLCRARILVHRSNGTGEDLIRIADLILLDDTAQIAVLTYPIASVIVRILNIALPHTTALLLASFLFKAHSAGVRLTLEWSESLPANTFRLDAGPGLDVGHLAGDSNT